MNMYLQNQLRQTKTDLKDAEARHELQIDELRMEYERKIERQRKRVQNHEREDKRLRETFMKSLYKDQQKYEAVINKRKNLQNQLGGIQETEPTIMESDDELDTPLDLTKTREKR